MQHESIDGVVVRVRDTGDHDRYLSILTAERGRISMLAKGSRSLKGGQTAVSQLIPTAILNITSAGISISSREALPFNPFTPFVPILTA